MAEVIDIDVRLKLDKSDVDAEVKTSTDSRTEEEIDEGINGPESLSDVVDAGFDEDEEEDKLKKTLDTTKEGIQNISSFGNGPLRFMGKFMPDIMNSLPIIGIITAIVALPEVIKKLVKQLTAKGSPFDRFLKILSVDAQNAFFTRMQQRDRQLGKRQVIFTTAEGFSNRNGALTGNSFKNLGTGITAGSDIGTTRTASILDKAEGL